jgi:hypothetical protein
MRELAHWPATPLLSTSRTQESQWSGPVPDEAEAEQPNRYERGLPDWAEQDSEEFKSARVAYTVILLGGALVWQEAMWYLDWGSGIGGYVPYIEPKFSGEYEGHERPQTGWQVSLWAVKLARLMNSFEGTHHWHPHDPTIRLVPEPDKMHPSTPAAPVISSESRTEPIKAARAGGAGMAVCGPRDSSGNRARCAAPPARLGEFP